jgi:thiol-disulfide isomerase/thioredoxin
LFDGLINSDIHFISKLFNLNLMSNLFLRTLLIFLTLVMIHSEAITQKKYIRLHIGDKVPDVKFSSVRNYTFQKKSLSDFKGKFIILDIWDKTCGTCIASMPHMEKLQKEFSDDLQVLLITQNNAKDLSLLLNNSKIVPSVRLPMIFGDTMITKHLFPYRWLPRHIWIDRDGKVIAITQLQEANETNVSRMISGQKLDLTVREDLTEDERDEIEFNSKPLLQAGNGKYLSNLCFYNSHNGFEDSGHYYSVIMKRIGGVHEGWEIQFGDKGENHEGIRFINFPLYRLFSRAYNYHPAYQSLIANVYCSSIPKIIVETDVSLLKEPAKNNISEHLRWEDETNFCYDMRLANAVKDNNKFGETLKLQMQKDLERCFGIKGIIEERQMRCFVLYRDSLNLNAYKKSPNLNEYFDRTLISDEPFFNVLLAMGAYFMNSEDPPLVNETGLYEEKVTMSFRRDLDLDNLKQLQEDFGRYGIKVKEEMRNYQVLVLRKASGSEK